MKRFLVFAGDFYYPGGGWDDFSNDYDDIEAARQSIRSSHHEWAHIVDTANECAMEKWARPMRGNIQLGWTKR